MATPDLLTSLDGTRARRLRTMKRNAVGLLLLAAAVFILTYVFTDGSGLAGYVRAASEAAMVGGVADWFAVTALFRHPLGLPIPHTAIIPRGKDAIGKGLGEFVQRNFMNPESLVDRVKEADLSRRLGEWLAEPDNAAAAARQAAGVIAAVAETINEEEIRDGIREMVAARIEDIDTAPLLGTVLDRTVAGGHHEALISAGMRGVGKAIAENRDLLRQRIRTESPWWVLQYLDEVVFEKIYVSLVQFIADIEADKNHELRGVITTRAKEFVQQLQSSPELGKQADQVKRKLLDHPEFAAWTDGLWSSLKENLTAAAEQPDSGLRMRLEQLALSTGERLTTDAELRA